jgi:acetyltransferase-like isoleucine patch superfamily enzyme
VPLEVIRAAGSGFYCGPGGFFRPHEAIRIGRNVFIGSCAHIAAPCDIRDDVMLASYVAVVGGDHRFDEVGVLLRLGGRGNMPLVVIEEDAWVGHGAILLAGTRIGRGAIVAAGSVVTSEVPPCEIWGGIPARCLKPRFAAESDMQRHLAYLVTRYGC